jgi:hypothetical protein
MIDKIDLAHVQFANIRVCSLVIEVAPSLGILRDRTNQSPAMRSNSVDFYCKNKVQSIRGLDHDRNGCSSTSHGGNGSYEVVGLETNGDVPRADSCTVDSLVESGYPTRQSIPPPSGGLT